MAGTLDTPLAVVLDLVHSRALLQASPVRSDSAGGSWPCTSHRRHARFVRMHWSDTSCDCRTLPRLVSSSEAVLTETGCDDRIVGPRRRRWATLGATTEKVRRGSRRKAQDETQNAGFAESRQRAGHRKDVTTRPEDRGDTEHWNLRRADWSSERGIVCAWLGLAGDAECSNPVRESQDRKRGRATFKSLRGRNQYRDGA